MCSLKGGIRLGSLTGLFRDVERSAEVLIQSAGDTLRLFTLGWEDGRALVFSWALTTSHPFLGCCQLGASISGQVRVEILLSQHTRAWSLWILWSTWASGLDQSVGHIRSCHRLGRVVGELP